MQNRTAFLYSVVIIALSIGVEATLSTASESNAVPLANINNATQTEKNSFPPVTLNITNDGPTILGSRTVFNVTVQTSAAAYISYQWGTIIPYRWMSLETYNYSVRLEVDWWKITGSKSVYFYIDALEKHTGKWVRVAVNSSSVEVIDFLSMSTTLTQHKKIIHDGKIEAGMANLIANIHDPSNFFRGLIVHYTWIFNDGTPTKFTTWNSMDHTFKSEGLFYIQISSTLRKDGKLYSGQTSFYVSVKATLTGYILTWKEDDHNHPMLPSKEKSFPIGLVNFQFKLVDIYSSFTNATFSYIWNYGDGTIEAALGNTTHVYDDTGHFVVAVGVSASQHGREYHSLLHKNISIREPIKDLDVKSQSKLKKGNRVQFNISCKGSAPLSFCWYVARGSCKLPSDVICSPTRLYHNCKNTINLTFHRSGDYCVNVTVINTVSFAEKSINVKVAEETAENKRNHSAVTAAAVLPIIAGLLLFIVLFLGIKHKMQHRKRLARKSEVATFDFRSSQFSLHGSAGCCCPFLMDCKCFCPNDDDPEEDHEMEERRTFLEEEPGSITPKRKISYYGSIHRILGQCQVHTSHPEAKEDDQSPFTPRRNLSKSV